VQHSTLISTPTHKVAWVSGATVFQQISFSKTMLATTTESPQFGGPNHEGKILATWVP
jgi:hypothetical protein